MEFSVVITRIAPCLGQGKPLFPDTGRYFSDYIQDKYSCT